MSEYSAFNRLGSNARPADPLATVNATPFPETPSNLSVEEIQSSTGPIGTSVHEPVRQDMKQAGDYSMFKRVKKRYTFGDQMQAFGEAAGSEAIRGSGAIAGAGIGGAIGGAVGGPPGALVGGLIGMVGGATIGDKARKELGLQAFEESPPETQGFANIGSVLGGSLIPAAGTATMARTGFRFGPLPGSLDKPSMVGAMVNDLADFAATSRTWGARETLMTGYSAAGSGLAGTVAPDNDLLRIGAEIGMPLAHHAVVSTASGAVRSTMNLVRLMKPSGQETVAAMILQQAFKSADGDPVVFNRIIRDFAKNNPEFDAAYLTPGQITGDPTAINLEKALSQINSKFGSRAAESAREGLEAVRHQIALFSAIGGENAPEALQIASALRVKYYDMMNDMIVRTATQDALDAVTRISTDQPRNAREISRTASEALGTAVEQVRGIERQLWDAVENLPTRDVSNLRNYFTTSVIGEDIPPQAYNDIPLEVRKFLYRMFVRGQDVGPVSKTSNDLVSVLSRDTAAHAPDPVFRGPETNTNELQNMRSRFLQMARAASKDPEKANMARIYNDLAESLLDDIDATFAASGASDAYTAARQFTKSKHDVFTRTFAGESMAEGRYGRRIDPEILLKRAMSTGGEVTALRMMELEQATRFLDTQGYGSHESYRIMADAQERMIRLMAIDAYDPRGETISVPKLKNFLKKYDDLLTERFPGVKREIEDAIQFSDHRKELVDMLKGQSRTMRTQNILGRIHGGQDPVEMGAKILRSPTRATKLVNTIADLKAALRGDIVDATTGNIRAMTPSEKRQALDGFSASLFEAAIYQSTTRTTSGGQVSPVLQPQLFRSVLFDPATPGQKPIIEIMRDEGLISNEAVTSIKRILDVSTKIQNYENIKPSELENQFSTELAILASRLLGSGTVGWLARKVNMGSSIIVHGAAARYAQTTATKLPQNKIINVLVDAFSDSTNNYEKLRLLSEKPTDILKQVENSRQLHAWFIRAGYLNTEDSLKEMSDLMFSIHDDTEKE